MFDKTDLLVAVLALLNLATGSPTSPPSWKNPVREHGKGPLGLQANLAVYPPEQIDACLINLVSALDNRHKTSPSIDIAATDAEFFNAKMDAEPMFPDSKLYIVRAGFGGMTCGKQKSSCRGREWRKTADVVGKVYQGGCFGSRCCGGEEGSCFDKAKNVDDVIDLLEKSTLDPKRPSWDNCDEHDNDHDQKL